MLLNPKIFTQNACILITACNAGTDAEIYDNNGDSQITSFAQVLADITGVTVFIIEGNSICGNCSLFQ